MRRTLSGKRPDDIIMISHDRTMTDILIRNVDPGTLERLKRRARNNGRSLQQELHEIILQAAGTRALDALALADRIRARLGKTHPRQSDSVDIIRRDRRR
jgi:plasmid stability protein